MKLSGRKGQLMVLTHGRLVTWSLGDLAFGSVVRQHTVAGTHGRVLHGSWEAKRKEKGGDRVLKSPSWTHPSVTKLCPTKPHLLKVPWTLKNARGWGPVYNPEPL